MCERLNRPGQEVMHVIPAHIPLAGAVTAAVITGKSYEIQSSVGPERRGNRSQKQAAGFCPRVQWEKWEIKVER